MSKRPNIHEVVCTKTKNQNNSIYIKLSDHIQKDVRSNGIALGNRCVATKMSAQEDNQQRNFYGNCAPVTMIDYLLSQIELSNHLLHSSLVKSVW
jgi:hypothetical protein